MSRIRNLQSPLSPSARPHPDASQTNGVRYAQVLSAAGTYTLLGVLSIISIFPFLWMLISATNTSVEVAKGKLSLGSALGINLTNFFTLVDGPLIFWNTLKITLLTCLFSLIISSIAGYGFEIFASKKRERVYNIMLLTMMVPFAAMLIPLFMMIAWAELIDTHTAVILPGIASAFLIFYFRQSAKAFPRELRDAARVDGLKEWQIFFLIFVPVMRSTYAAAFIIVFMTTWNSFLWPLVVLQSPDMKTLTLAISTLAGGDRPDFGVIMVGAVIATLPTLIVFFAMQRQFVQGMLGSVK